MKMFFTVVLVLSALTEALAATTLIGGPEGFTAAGKGAMWSMHYGFAALAIASVSLWAWPYRSDLRVVTAALGTLLTFHTGLFISLTLAGDQPAGMVIHAVLSVLCLITFIRRKSWAA